MIIHNGIAMLALSANVMGKTTVIHPTLLWDGDRVVLVDTGFPGQLPLIQAAMDEAGIPLDTLTDLMLTHQDIDHIGCLPALLERIKPSPVVWASEIEQPYIQGDKLLLKVTPEAVDKAVAALPKDVPDEMRRAFRHALLNPPKGQVDRLIGGGHNDLPIDGLTVLDTPGHTPGHVSLYHAASKTLIAGDALVVHEDKLQLADASINIDNAQALRSLKPLIQLDIAGVICYHGGYFKGDVRSRILELLEQGTEN
ncbi:MBL fold metallo-hydrolase [Paenibacillus rhizovicinus]|uniref:MBL fold metallo-hydrolase n=1 Tax=Paenibacillus rhizovicinus TaxID=2704463 RepID=A0A6C0NVC4_9BACL|nr:MBL fold metallo-hydrolase [Paenibacillus rhizovicinus]QHW30139.1 MBL fold metallo-hydrolase [Paenibacillus rhizovicinus]